MEVKSVTGNSIKMYCNIPYTPPGSHFWDGDFPFPKVGYVSSVEGIGVKLNHQTKSKCNIYNKYCLYMRMQIYVLCWCQQEFPGYEAAESYPTPGRSSCICWNIKTLLPFSPLQVHVIVSLIWFCISIDFVMSYEQKAIVTLRIVEFELCLLHSGTLFSNLTQPHRDRFQKWIHFWYRRRENTDH